MRTARAAAAVLSRAETQRSEKADRCCCAVITFTRQRFAPRQARQAVVVKRRVGKAFSSSFFRVGSLLFTTPAFRSFPIGKYSDRQL